MLSSLNKELLPKYKNMAAAFGLSLQDIQPVMIFADKLNYAIAEDSKEFDKTQDYSDYNRYDALGGLFEDRIYTLLDRPLETAETMYNTDNGQVVMNWFKQANNNFDEVANNAIAENMRYLLV